MKLFFKSTYTRKSRQLLIKKAIVSTATESAVIGIPRLNKLRKLYRVDASQEASCVVHGWCQS